jgi:enamine deaminase RidA (YjgF/YER057c/UK114 family)
MSRSSSWKLCLYPPVNYLLLPASFNMLVKAGSDVSQEDAYAAAKICALNCLAAVNTVANVEDIEQIVKVLGFVASPQGFNAQPAVVNGASELLVKIFDDKGKHARSAVGVAELPLNAPVEVEMIVKLKD